MARAIPLPASLQRAALFVRTISHLRAGQIFYLVLRRLIPVRAALLRTEECPRIRTGVRVQPPIVGTSRCSGEHQYEFLNVSKSFGSGKVDWASADMTKLWRYNLHYFDYVLEPQRPKRSVAALISDWIERNPIGLGDGWEPYPVSLRVVNWVKLFLRPDFRNDVRPEWTRSLYEQVRWLERNVEHHILANHYLKNAKALLFAGVYFEGADAERWLRSAASMLVEQAREQLLGDGGHYERSPMYHSIVTEDYLDVLNLVGGASRGLTGEQTRMIEGKVRLALDFIHAICLPDGSIPLFNDSAFNIAPSVSALTEYAARIFEYRAPSRRSDLHVRSFQESGYFVIRNGDDMLVVDCGEIGPDYQPGHAHCDTLSYELASGGRTVIVDSGVYDYEQGDMRRYVRSTGAHNTARVDGTEQSELWSAFRVGRRARPLHASLALTSKSTARFSGSHDGFKRLPGAPVHSRTIGYDARGVWTVTDEFTGRGSHGLETFLHVHPDFEVRRVAQRVFRIACGGQTVCEIEILEGDEVTRQRGWYCPEFGVRRENAVITLRSAGALPRCLAYRIVKGDGRGAHDRDSPADADAMRASGASVR